MPSDRGEESVLYRIEFREDSVLVLKINNLHRTKANNSIRISRKHLWEAAPIKLDSRG